MTKKLYIVLIVLMSISLVGIVSLQVYWISESIKVKEDQFSQLVTQALKDVSSELEYIDMRKFVERYKKTIKELKGDQQKTQEALIGLNRTDSRSIIAKEKQSADPEYPNIQFVISREDSIRANIISTGEIELKSLTSKSINDSKDADLQLVLSLEDSISTLELALLQEKYNSLGDKISIRRRINNEVLNNLIGYNLRLNKVNTRYEYAILSNGLITPLYSTKFRQKGNEYVVPIFPNSQGKFLYELYVQFPHKRDFVLSKMWMLLAMSVLFTLVIAFTYGGALYLIFKHKKSSEVKTDFINNMSHELKTPIATINISIDALTNPKTLSDKEKILYYSNVIKEENKRMHNQIENVLRISRLDRNMFDLKKEECNLHDVVEEAIEHVLLIVEDRGGEINFDFNAEIDTAKADPLHLGNALVNILDNANKYSEGVPQIQVRTFNEDSNFVVEIKDNGMGISKAAQKKIFEKFYRVSSGNVHNIKGQGLGLAYVQHIVLAHHGQISVSSKPGHGSVFKVVLPTFDPESLHQSESISKKIH